MCNCLNVAVCMVVDVITITGCGASPDDLFHHCDVMPPIKSSVLQPHLSTSCPFISDAIYSPRIGSKLTIGFQKSRLLFFLPITFFVIHHQIHSTADLWPLTVSDSLFATCENVSISMTP